MLWVCWYAVGMLLVCCGYVGMLWVCCWYAVGMLVCCGYVVGMLWVCWYAVGMLVCCTYHCAKCQCPEVFVSELKHSVQCGRLPDALVQLTNDVGWSRLHNNNNTSDE